MHRVVVRLATVADALSLVHLLSADEQRALAGRGEQSLAAGALLAAHRGGLCSSRAHTSTLVAVACGDVPVGVDVERVLPAGAADDLFLARTCSPAESRAVREAADPELALTRLWVRKEAVAKADGRGLALPFAQLDVRAEQVGPWWLYDVPVGHGHLAAVASRGPAALDVSWWP